MKFTNTVRTIALSGLGLLAGASSLTLQADSAQAMSSYQAFGTDLVDTQMTLRTWAPSPRTGVFKVSAQCGEWAVFNGSMQMTNFCPGVVTFQMHRLSDNTFLGEQEVELDGREFVGELEHLVEEAIVITASYAGGTKVVNNVTHKYTPAQVSKEVVLVCNPTHDDLEIDGSDQNCDEVDGLNVDGDRFASVEVGGLDCDDSNPLIFPGAVDLYGDGIDQDCSGADGVDLDGDGFAAASVGGPDCDDHNPLFNPGALDDVGDDIDQNCDGVDGIDADQDGYASIESLGSDCDDLEAMTNIGSADSVGDGVDNNCDGLDGVDFDQDRHASTQSGGTDCDDSVATTYLGAADGIGDSVDSNCDGLDGADADRDGYASALSGGTDCDDSVATTYPGAADGAGDAVDNNCDGVDGVDADRDGQASNQSGGTDCDDANAAIYTGALDNLGDAVDSNCDGVDGVDLDQDGYRTIASGGNDCDDSDASINPAQLDRVDADEVDSNCDGTDGVDADFDGVASLASGGQDCNDRDATVYPSADELEGDSKDSNCDGSDDPDLDADGVSSERDCDDSNATVYPGAAELMGDGVDNNCDGRIDELYLDRDGDGFGAMDEGGTDCDDDNAEAYPDAEEILDDGIDQDCDGVDDVEVLGVYLEQLRFNRRSESVSCSVIEDYKTIDCFSISTGTTVMRRTFEFDGQLKDFALSRKATSGCALSDRGELECWDDPNSDLELEALSFNHDQYDEALSLFRGTGGAICVMGAHGPIECIGETSPSDWDVRSGLIFRQDTMELYPYNNFIKPYLPSSVELKHSYLRPLEGLFFGNRSEGLLYNRRAQIVSRDACGLVYTDLSLYSVNPSESLIMIPSLMCVPEIVPTQVKYSRLDFLAGYGAVQTLDNWLITWTDGQVYFGNPKFVPEPMKVRGFVENFTTYAVILESGRLKLWSVTSDWTENVPVQYR